MDNKKEVELQERYIVLAIPKDTVEVEINAKVWHNGEIIAVSKTMCFDEVRAMFKEAEHGYIPENAVFTLTDAAREALEKLKHSQLCLFQEDE